MSGKTTHKGFARFVAACQRLLGRIEQGRDWRAALRRALDHPIARFSESERAAARTILLNIAARAIDGQSDARPVVYRRAAALLAESDRRDEFARMLRDIDARIGAHGPGAGVDGDLDPRVTPGLNYLRSRYADATLSLADAARHANLSKWHFDRLLKQVTGATFRYHLLEIRMLKATELLDNTRLEIKEVADQVGYKHVSHFSRHFKRRHGVSASDYRRRAFAPGPRNRG